MLIKQDACHFAVRRDTIRCGENKGHLHGAFLLGRSKLRPRREGTVFLRAGPIEPFDIMPLGVGLFDQALWVQGETYLPMRDEHELAGWTVRVGVGQRALPALGWDE